MIRVRFQIISKEKDKEGYLLFYTQGFNDYPNIHECFQMVLQFSKIDETENLIECDFSTQEWVENGFYDIFMIGSLMMRKMGPIKAFFEQAINQWELELKKAKEKEKCKSMDS